MNNINDEIFERKLEETFEQEEYKDICAVFVGEDEEFYKGVRFTLAYLKAKETISQSQQEHVGDMVERFGGKDKVKEATKTKAIDDVYCWELNKWVSNPYWNAKMKGTYTGVTLRELAIAAKV